MGEVIQQPDDLLRFSIKRLAREFGMARETVSTRIAAAGVRAAGKQSGYDVYLLRDVALVVLQPVAGIQPSDADFDPAKLPPKDRRDWYESEKKRLDVETTQGDLVPIHEFRSEVAAICKTLAGVIETIPDILERDCGLDGPTIDRLQSVLDAQRNELADRLEDIEL